MKESVQTSLGSFHWPLWSLHSYRVAVRQKIVAFTEPQGFPPASSFLATWCGFLSLTPEGFPEPLSLNTNSPSPSFPGCNTPQAAIPQTSSPGNCLLRKWLVKLCLPGTGWTRDLSVLLADSSLLLPWWLFDASLSGFASIFPMHS